MSEKPSLNFDTPEFNYDELEAQLGTYQPDPDRYPHDSPSFISIEEGIAAGYQCPTNRSHGGCAEAVVRG